jgi:hypothetical protein
MKGDVKLRDLVEVTVGGAGQAEPGQCVVERILNGLEGATPQDGVEQQVRRRVWADRPGSIPEPNGAQSMLVTDRGVAETPAIGARCPAGTDKRKGSTPKNAVSLTTASYDSLAKASVNA